MNSEHLADLISTILGRVNGLLDKSSWTRQGKGSDPRPINSTEFRARTREVQALLSQLHRDVTHRDDGAHVFRLDSQLRGWQIQGEVTGFFEPVTIPEEQDRLIADFTQKMTEVGFRVEEVK